LKKDKIPRKQKNQGLIFQPFFVYLTEDIFAEIQSSFALGFSNFQSAMGLYKYTKT